MHSRSTRWQLEIRLLVGNLSGQILAWRHAPTGGARPRGERMPRTIDATEVPALLRPRMSVFIQGVTTEPSVLLGAIAAVPEASDGVHYLACLIPGVNRVDPAAFHPRARLTSLFVHPDIERSYAAGRVRFMPLHYSGFYDYLARHRPRTPMATAASGRASTSLLPCSMTPGSWSLRSTARCRPRPARRASPGSGSIGWSRSTTPW
jgi:hypothetical protein